MAGAEQGRLMAWAEESPYERDLAWLEIEVPNATDRETEVFTERVAMKTQDVQGDYAAAEQNARKEAKIELIKNRAKKNKGAL